MTSLRNVQNHDLQHKACAQQRLNSGLQAHRRHKRTAATGCGVSMILDLMGSIKMEGSCTVYVGDRAPRCKKAIMALCVLTTNAPC